MLPHIGAISVVMGAAAYFVGYTLVWVFARTLGIPVSALALGFRDYVILAVACLVVVSGLVVLFLATYWVGRYTLERTSWLQSTRRQAQLSIRLGGGILVVLIAIIGWLSIRGGLPFYLFVLVGAVLLSAYTTLGFTLLASTPPDEVMRRRAVVLGTIAVLLVGAGAALNRTQIWSESLKSNDWAAGSSLWLELVISPTLVEITGAAPSIADDNEVLLISDGLGRSTVLFDSRVFLLKSDDIEFVTPK